MKHLLAHYLLGRAYHEHGEAPMALQCYHDAIDCANTTAADCDYAQLARVYGQMGDIFYNQWYVCGFLMGLPRVSNGHDRFL